MLNIKPLELHHSKSAKNNSIVFLIEKGNFDRIPNLKDWQKKELKETDKTQQTVSVFNDEKSLLFIIQIEKVKHKELYKSKEEARKLGVLVLNELKKYIIEEVDIMTNLEEQELLLSVAEGIVLGKYQFNTYRSDKKKSVLKKLNFVSEKLKKEHIEELENLLTSVYYARTLVNEPVNVLDAVRLSKEIEKLGKDANFSVKVLDKKAIEKENMGGLLSVNLGSQTPPTFSILEYNPKHAKNKKPIVLVGKGIVFDTGGLSLKPTAGSMDSMKSDMAGAAAVICAIHALAKNNIPAYVVGLIPATDNRPGEMAYVPGDIITMHNGTTVEVLNTDAEGRLILADALSYSKKYDPEIVIDMATLTGAQVVAIGSIGAAMMGNADHSDFKLLRDSGNDTYERVAEMPFWEEYSDMIKSDIADLKNIGGKEAGCITAGKFLEKFVSHPWVHIDIAGPSFLDATNGYRIKGGTGFGVKLLYQFIKSKIN